MLYNRVMKKNQEYHSTSIGEIANGLCAVLNVANVAPGGEPEELVRYAFRGNAQRVLLFCPAALGSDICDRFAQYLDNVKDVAPMRMDWVAPYPGNSKHSLQTMLTGASDDKTHAGKTVFDACEGKKRCAVVCNKRHLKEGFANAEWIVCNTDMEVVSKSIALLKQDCYDFLVVCVNEFDTMMGATPLFGNKCAQAFSNHTKEFALLCDAASVYQKINTLVGFCPEYGAHKGFLCGKHNRHYASDLNVTHYYGVVSGLKDPAVQEMLQEEEGKEQKPFPTD